MATSGYGKLLILLLVAFLTCDFLLTPLGWETRSVSRVTFIGLVTLGILFLGLALDLASIVATFRRPKAAAVLAIVGSFCYFPVFLTDQTHQFSALDPPVNIVYVEWLALVVALGVIGVAVQLYRKTHRTTGLNFRGT
jgi:hypothetical protein